MREKARKPVPSRLVITFMQVFFHRSAHCAPRTAHCLTSDFRPLTSLLLALDFAIYNSRFTIHRLRSCLALFSCVGRRCNPLERNSFRCPLSQWERVRKHRTRSAQPRKNFTTCRTGLAEPAALLLLTAIQFGMAGLVQKLLESHVKLVQNTVSP